MPEIEDVVSVRMELRNDKKWLIIQLINLSSNVVCWAGQKGFSLTVLEGRGGEGEQIK